MISYCLSTNQSKDGRTFRGSTSIISCVRERERAFYALYVVDDDRYFKYTKARPTREVLSTRHIWYDWRQPKHNFLLMKNPNGRVKLKTVVTSQVIKIVVIIIIIVVILLLLTIIIIFIVNIVIIVIITIIIKTPVLLGGSLLQYCLL